MATPPIDPAAVEKIQEMVRLHPDWSYRTIANKLGMREGTVYNHGHKVRTFVGKPTPAGARTDSTWAITLPETRIHTLEDLVKYCEIDLAIWEVERFICNKWEMGYVRELDKGPKQKDGSQHEARVADHKQLFQVKAFLKKRKEVVAARKEIAALKLECKKHAPLPKAVVRPSGRGGHMLEVDIPDAHYGKLSWGQETGGSNYDTKIADDLFWEAFCTLLERVKPFQFDEVLFVVGNDLLNSDDVEGRTTKGTNVTTDGRFKKTFAIVRNRMITCIEKLRTLAPVKVVMVPGNHDTLSVWHLGDSLECYFHRYKDVTIDNGPMPRKYYRFGQVMLLFTHGDKGKRNDYPLLMATEQRKMFGDTKFHEVHTGHNHMTKLDEQHGVRVRVLPALTAADDWHSENHFVGNIRAAEAYVWHKDEGLVSIAIFNTEQ